MALAPLVVWGVIITAILLVVPRNWFWTAYVLQMINIAGAAGDIYVSVKFSKMPDDILVMDTGVEMKVYSSK